MPIQQPIPAAGGAGLRLKRGESLRIIDPHGGQSGDLVVFSADGHQRLSNGRTFDYGGKIYLSKGDVLWSDRSEPMLTTSPMTWAGMTFSILPAASRCTASSTV